MIDPLPQLVATFSEVTRFLRIGEEAFERIDPPRSVGWGRYCHATLIGKPLRCPRMRHDRQTGGKRTDAAQRLGIDRRTLYGKIKKYGITPDMYK